jgi:hypothetical protein
VEIGRGGTGVVYRGRQSELLRDVAVKVVFSTGAPEEALRRWRREVTAMARLSNHPNIVAVFDGGVTDDGLPYLVMPLVPGGTLSDRLRSSGPFTPVEVVAIGTKLAGALGAAHDAGVLHRDVKPANVLMSPYEEPQLTDFGIARLLDTTATMTSSVHATVTYAAPEVLAGQPATEASDVYSLGATLHTCLTNAAPYTARPGESVVSLALRVISEPAPDLRSASSHPGLVEVIELAMAKEPAERIPTAAELARRLAHALSSPAPREREDAPPRPAPVPVQTSAPTRVMPASPRNPARRPWAIVAGAAAVVLGALVVAAILLGRGGEGDTPEVAPVTPVAEAPAEPTSPAARGAPSTPSTTAESEPPPATEDALGDAARTYFEALGRGDVEGAYAMTTTGFQDAQPFDGYREFWGGFDRITVEGEPTVDDEQATVTVTLRLDGSREVYTLQFVRDEAGTLVVDGPRPR